MSAGYCTVMSIRVFLINTTIRVLSENFRNTGSFGFGSGLGHLEVDQRRVPKGDAGWSLLYFNFFRQCSGGQFFVWLCCRTTSRAAKIKMVAVDYYRRLSATLSSIVACICSAADRRSCTFFALQAAMATRSSASFSLNSFNSAGKDLSAAAAAAWKRGCGRAMRRFVGDKYGMSTLQVMLV
jgi:hypothetical protein